MAEANKDILDLIAAVKSGNAQALKDRKAALDKEEQAIGIDKANAGKIKAEIERQGGKAENNSKYNKAQTEITRRSLKLEQDRLKLEIKNTPFFSESRKQIKSQIKENKRKERDTTILGKMLKSVSGLSPAAQKELGKKQASADKKNTSVLSKTFKSGLGKVVDVLATPLKVGAGAIAILSAAGLMALIKFLESDTWKSIRRFITTEGPLILQDIKTTLKELYDKYIKPIMDFLSTEGVLIFEDLKAGFKKVFDSLVLYVTDTIENLVNLFSTLFNPEKTFTEKIMAFFTFFDTQIAALFDFFARIFGLEETEGSITGHILKKFMEFYDSIVLFVTDGIESAMTSINETIDGIVTGISDAISGFFTMVRDKFYAIQDVIGGTIESVVLDVTDFLKAMIEGIKDFIFNNPVVQGIKSFLGAAFDKIENFGESNEPEKSPPQQVRDTGYVDPASKGGGQIQYGAFDSASGERISTAEIQRRALEEKRKTKYTKDMDLTNELTNQIEALDRKIAMVRSMGTDPRTGEMEQFTLDGIARLEQKKADLESKRSGASNTVVSQDNSQRVNSQTTRQENIMVSDSDMMGVFASGPA